MAVIMGWGKCSLAIKENTGNDFPALSGFTLLDNIKEDATSIDATEGDEYVAKTTGGIVIARERAEGSFSLKTTILEPSEAIYTTLGIATASSSGVQNITTTVVPGIFAVRLDPRNVGAVGIEIPTASITATPHFSDKEGWSLELTFNINHNGSYHYRKYIKKKAGLANTETGK